MNKPYLENEEIYRAKMCCSNILDKFQAIEREVRETERPFKAYIREKAKSIAHDIAVIQSMCEESEEDV